MVKRILTSERKFVTVREFINVPNLGTFGTIEETEKKILYWDLEIQQWDLVNFSQLLSIIEEREYYTYQASEYSLGLFEDFLKKLPDIFFQGTDLSNYSDHVVNVILYAMDVDRSIRLFNIPKYQEEDEI